jgi:hypothetical protein
MAWTNQTARWIAGGRLEQRHGHHKPKREPKKSRPNRIDHREYVAALPISHPDNSFISLLSACSACIVVPHLR